MKILQEKSIEKVNVITTSEDQSMYQPLPCYFPEKFAKYSFYRACGFVWTSQHAGINQKRHSQRSKLKELREDLSRPDVVKDAKYAAKPMGAYKVRVGNIPASFREIQAISKADITEALAEMHEQGIGISIIHAVDDKVFPMDKVQKNGGCKSIGRFYSVWGTHDNYYVFETIRQGGRTLPDCVRKKEEKLRVTNNC